MNDKIKFKKCDTCQKFYDTSNNNFFLNFAISKFKNKDIVSNELLKSLQENINRTSEIDWCTCFHEEKSKAAEEAAATFDNTFSNPKDSFDIKEIGLDFTINKNILYIQNNKFSEAHFLGYCKSLKQNLNGTIFDFDFLTADKISDERFLRHFKNYYINPNFLLISELHKIKENQIEELKNVVSIIKERISNNKKTFILLNQDLELFKKTLKANNWAKNELIYNELIDLISEDFNLKLITVSNKNDTVVVNTLDYESSKPVKKKSRKAEQPVQAPKNNLDPGFDA